MPSKKPDECLNCGTKYSVLRAYIRVNENYVDLKRKWKTIGWYCTECFYFHNDWGQ